MILVDANLLIYAEDSLCDNHDAARTWWDVIYPPVTALD
jgi:predicted nucleic acid-binding protein